MAANQPFLDLLFLFSLLSFNAVALDLLQRLILSV
jgi:hypothetical protein